MDGSTNGPASNALASNKLVASVRQQFKYWLDRSTPHYYARWAALAALVFCYSVRVYLIRGFYIVTYALGIFNLNLLLGFLSPQIDPEQEGPTLPSNSEEEFRPFVRRLPEFKFWYSSARAFLIGFAMTFFPIFDVPVFWPILLLYFFVLLYITMKRQIKHMIKYKYVPFSFGKKTYKGKSTSKSST